MLDSSVTTILGIVSVKLDGVVLADKIEARLANKYDVSGSIQPVELGSICLDFREATYIDVAALVNCVAILTDRKKRQLTTFIKYPKSKEVRDFLAVWRFSEAVAAATGEPVEEFLDYDDYPYLCETQTTYTGRGGLIDAVEYDADWQDHSRSKRNFFEFTTFSSESGQVILPRGVFAASPRLESTRWANELIKKVLERHLSSGAPSDEIARVVVYEAMSNAVRHPGARIIQTVSRFLPKVRVGTPQAMDAASIATQSARKISGTLRLCVWDDGEGIAETLRRPIAQGKSVRALSLPPYMLDQIEVERRDFGENVVEKRIFNQAVDPTADSPEYELLLSSLYPGITRTASESVPNVEPYDTQQQGNASTPIRPFAPGMGLYALTRTALDQFRGSLFLRSGHYRLLLELASRVGPSSPGVRYKCKITEYPRDYPQFCGNLLVVQLPTRD